MSIKQKTVQGAILLAACIGLATTPGAAFAAKKKFGLLNEAEFEQAKGIYFQHGYRT